MVLTISPEVATLVSGIIGGTVGALGNYAIQLSLQKKQENSETRSLRKSLSSELEAMNTIDSFQLGPRNIPSRYAYSKNVFENSSSKLGLLSDPEAVSIVRFYGTLSDLNGQISEFTRAKRQSREIDSDRHAASRQASTEVNRRFKQIRESFDEMRRH